MTALAWLVRHSCSTASGSPPFSGRCAPASSRTSKAPPIARSRTILRKIQTALNNKRPRGHSGPYPGYCFGALDAGAIVPLQMLLAETVTGWIGVRNIFDLTIDTGGAIPLVVVVMLIEALVVDFFFYWFHRCQHTVGVLWQVHMLHHTDMALNVTTTHRVHFLEHLLTPFFMIAPIMLLFELPDRDIYWIALAPTVWSYVVHANVRIGFGKFWWLLSSPQYHRIHHSILP
jgi:sterol desaturase/sphingolipid hydroxylase (fatty acid hydroxylase superfamily)